MPSYTEEDIKRKLIKELDATHVEMQKLPRETCLGLFGVLVAVFLRVCVSLHPHSGQGKPPMFGDYEAQRHWMEITVNLPLRQWYHNSSANDLLYWGLDYPPLTAYHSYLCGLFAGYLNRDYVALVESRGYESDAHKLFMRVTVLLADLFVYIPAVILYFYATQSLYADGDDGGVKTRQRKAKSRPRGIPVAFLVVSALFYPGIILIDHGHFQYNCVSLGLMISAVTCVCLNHNIFASILFCLALNYKQMELYHAFPFFLYLLSACVPKPGTSLLSAFGRLFKIAVAVVGTFVVIWLPFLFRFEDAVQVLHRLFPVARGVFEDKVANVWCALNIVYKFRTKYDNAEMFRICAATTLAALLPSSIDLFVRPSLRKFVPALINSSLAFFLFSFQVHEKSILLAAVPVMLYMQKQPIVSFWFLNVSVFSMFPLILKDGLTTASIALTLFYITSFKLIYEYSYKYLKSDNTFYMYYRAMLNTFMGMRNGEKTYVDISSLTYKHYVRNKQFLKQLLLCVTLMASLAGCLVLVVAFVSLEPPSKYPDFYPLLVSVYSCVHFLGFFAFFNVLQFQIPQDFDKIKTS